MMLILPLLAIRHLTWLTLIFNLVMRMSILFYCLSLFIYLLISIDGIRYRDNRQGVLGAIPNQGYPGQTPLIQGTPVTQQGQPQQGAVLMVYGLNHQMMNCDKLFNLLCQYGNVVRVCYIFFFFVFLYKFLYFL